MSAYIMEPRDIEAIGLFVDRKAREGKLFCYRKLGKPRANYEDNYLTGQRVAEILMRENVRSVNFRYSERNRSPKLNIDDAGEPDATEVASLLSTWCYQACERKDFYRSEAYEVYVALLELALKVAVDEIGELKTEIGGLQASWRG